MVWKPQEMLLDKCSHGATTLYQSCNPVPDLKISSSFQHFLSHKLGPRLKTNATKQAQTSSTIFWGVFLSCNWGAPLTAWSLAGGYCSTPVCRPHLHQTPLEQGPSPLCWCQQPQVTHHSWWGGAALTSNYTAWLPTLNSTGLAKQCNFSALP